MKTKKGTRKQKINRCYLLLEQGKTASEIMQLLHVSRSTLYTYFVCLGSSFKQLTNAEVTENIQMVLKLKNQGLAFDEIAKQLNFTILDTLRYYAERDTPRAHKGANSSTYNKRTRVCEECGIKGPTTRIRGQYLCRDCLCRDEIPVTLETVCDSLNYVKTQTDMDNRYARIR